MKLKKLLDREDGAIIVELAYSLPIFLGLGITGIEFSSLAIAHMEISQIAITTADNLSRAKNAVPLALPQLREHDVNDAFTGAQIQSAELAVLNNGRIVVSSLQRNNAGGQWIAWQRCKGVRNVASAYGVQGTGATGTAFPGMGPGTNAQKIQVEAGGAIIFVEVTYIYRPLVASSFVGNTTIRKEAAFYVRDDRDLTQIYNPNPSAPVATCNLFTAT